MKSLSSTIQDQTLIRLLFDSSSIAIAQFDDSFQITESSSLFRMLLSFKEGSRRASLLNWLNKEDLELLSQNNYQKELNLKKGILSDSGETIFLKAKLIGQYVENDFVGGILLLENETIRIESIIKAKTKVHELSELIFALFSKSPLGILKICPQTARILQANTRICKMLGYSKSELKEKTAYEITHPGDWDLHKEQYNKSLKGECEAFDFESRLICKDLGVIWVHIAVAIAKDEDGNAEYDVCSIIDVSKAHKAKMLIKDQIEILNYKNQELEKYIDSNLQLENFAYIASHDLKAPLRTIGNFAQLLKRRMSKHFEESEHEYMDFILTGVKDMSQLIEDLLSYSKIGTKENTVNKLNLPHILNNVLRNLDVIISEKSAEVIIGDIPETIIANKTKLTQLFQNLIANGLKFQTADSIPKIHVKGLDGPSHWTFEVADNGIGMAKQYHEQIFDLFQRLNGKTEYEGSGIGLAYCKRVVEKHQGEIWLESEEGKGTTFFFTIAKSD